MKKAAASVLIWVLTLILCSFTYPVSASIRFVSYDRNSGLEIQGVILIVINRDGEVIDILTTDKNGQAEKKISAPLDRRYLTLDSYDSLRRGTVTVIAYKKGYCETVLFEVPVNPDDSSQPFSMNPVAFGQRNEPVMHLAVNHHLAIGELVDKYRQYLEGN